MNSVLELAQSLARTPRILVVDDDHYIRRVFDTLAQTYEIVLALAASPQEGLLCIRRAEFDVIFLDMRFDQAMTGMDVLREINRMGCNTHVIVMSGSINLHDVMAEANQLGVVSFMLKPISFNIEFVRTILGRLGIRLVERSEQKTDRPSDSRP